MEMDDDISGLLEKCRSYLSQNRKKVGASLILMGVAFSLFAIVILAMYLQEAVYDYSYYYLDAPALALILATAGIFLLYVGAHLQGRARLQMNMLCILGAIIGLLSVYETWNYHASVCAARGMDDQSRNLLEVIYDMNSFPFPGILFVLGTIVTFYSPLGGIFQCIGVVSFGALYLAAHGTFSDHWGGVGFGFILGIISTMVVLISLIRPMGIGLENDSFGLKGRLLTISKVKRRCVSKPPS